MPGRNSHWDICFEGTGGLERRGGERCYPVGRVRQLSLRTSAAITAAEIGSNTSTYFIVRHTSTRICKYEWGRLSIAVAVLLTSNYSFLYSTIIVRARLPGSVILFLSVIVRRLSERWQYLQARNTIILNENKITFQSDDRCFSPTPPFHEELLTERDNPLLTFN